MGRKKKNAKNQKISKKASKEREEAVVVTKQPPLYIFKMCRECVKDCKMSGIKGAVLEHCPHFENRE